MGASRGVGRRWLAAIGVVGAVVAASCVPPPEPYVHFPTGSSPVTPQSPDATGPIRLVGRHLVDAEGRAVLLHGMNLVTKSAPYYPRLGVDLTEADFEYFGRNGFNAVRLGVWYRELLPQPGVVDEQYLEHVQQVVDAFAAHHIWVLLDFHQDVFVGMPSWATTPEAAALSDQPPEIAKFIGWAAGYASPRAIRQWDDLWADRPTATDPTRTMFRALGEGAAAMAARFASNPYVMGMELMNEPFAGSELLACLTDGCGALEATMATRWQSMTDQVHAVAPRFNVFWSPQVLAPHYTASFLPGPAPRTDGSSTDVGLTFHTYCYATDGGSLDVPSDFDRGRCQAMFNASLPRGNQIAAAWNAPMMLTEFGASANPLDATLATRATDAWLTSWFYWHYGRNFYEELETQLIRTSPQATAGEPLSLAFDPTSGRFEYRYRPSAAATGPTTIFVPDRQYPKGYSATVVGGSVVSAPNSGHLIVVADGSGADVSVRVDRIG